MREPAAGLPGRERPERSRTSASGPIAAAVALLCGAFLMVGLLPEGSRPGPAADGRSPVGEVLPAEVVQVPLDVALAADIAAYRGPRRAAALAGLVVAVAVPGTVAFALAAGGGRRALARLRALPGLPLQVGVATASIVLLTALLRSPLAAWAGVVHDGRWGFRTATAARWALDHAVVAGGRALGAGVLAAAVVLLMLARPRSWPALLTLLVAAAGPLVLLLHPVVVHPLLLPTSPMPAGAHRDAVDAVVARSTVDVEVVIGEASSRTTRRNAVATGLGPTARIVVHDTFLELSPREVAAIVAHEVAHLERRDPLRAALAPVPVVALLAWSAHLLLRRRRAVDLRGLVAAAALLLALEALATPVRSGLVRTVEHRTDARSVALAEDPEALVAVLHAFVVDGLADPSPPRWSVLLWGTHPAPADRIATVGGVLVSDADGPARR